MQKHLFDYNYGTLYYLGVVQSATVKSFIVVSKSHGTCRRMKTPSMYILASDAHEAAHEAAESVVKARRAGQRELEEQLVAYKKETKRAALAAAGLEFNINGEKP